MRGKRAKMTSKKIYVFNYLNTLSKILSVLILICLLIFIYSSIKVKKSLIYSKDLSPSENTSETFFENNDTTDFKTIQETQKDTTITMAFTGDIMCHNTIYNDAYSTTSRNL